MGADGALQKDVLSALAAKGCALDKQENGSIRVGLKAAVQVHHFGAVVSRTKLQQLSRVYDIPMGNFFPPLRTEEQK
jgi:hypothetical protein